MARTNWVMTVLSENYRQLYQPAEIMTYSPQNVMARLDRAITLSLVMMPMARSSRAMTDYFRPVGVTSTDGKFDPCTAHHMMAHLERAIGDNAREPPATEPRTGVVRERRPRELLL